MKLKRHFEWQWLMCTVEFRNNNEFGMHAQFQWLSYVREMWNSNVWHEWRTIAAAVEFLFYDMTVLQWEKAALRQWSSTVVYIILSVWWHGDTVCLFGYSIVCHQR